MLKRKSVLWGLALFAALSACSGEKQLDSTDVPQSKAQPAEGGFAGAPKQDVGAPPEAITVGGLGDTSEAGRTGKSEAAVQGAALPLPQLGVKVIKSADLEVRVGKGDFQEKFSKASLIAEQLGGFVTKSSISETEGKIASGTITLRVPSDKFQSALAELRALGTVTRESQGGQDVTQEFVDLEARLRHAKSQEGFYLRLMDEAKTISDLIQIQQQLSQVQLQIEELTGRLEFLKDQTSFSTLSMRLFEAGLEPSRPKKGLAKAWQEAIDGFKNVVGGAIVAVGWIAPFLLGGVGIAVALRLLRNRARGSRNSESG